MDSKTLTSKKLKELMAKSVDKIDWGWITYYLFEKIEDLEEKDRIDFNDLAQRIDNLKIYPLSDFREKIEDLEFENKLLKQIIKEKIEYALAMNEALEESEGYNEFSDKYRKKQEVWLKQLEEKTKYYDIKTLTHFISDIEDWIKTQKFECQINGLMFDVIDIGELEQFLIDREKQMKRYNKTITEKQLEEGKK